jgi:signal transduction histidine kinase
MASAARPAPATDGARADRPAPAEATLRTVADAAGLGVWEFWPREQRLVWDDAMRRVFETDPETLGPGAEAFFALTDPRDADRVAAFMAKPAGERDVGFEYRIVLPGGRLRWLRLSRAGVDRDAAGAVVRVYGWGLDVSDLRSAQERAESAESRLRQAVDALPFGFVIYDADDRLVLCNQPYLDLGPLSAPAIWPGARFEDILRCGLAAGEYPEAVGREEAWFAERLALHRAGDNDFEQLREGGRWIRSVARKTANGDHVGIRIDITDQKQLMETLEQSRAAAEAASAAKSQFLARMSHEIRTPMNGVLGMSDLLSRRLTDPELRAMIEVVRESGRLLMTVIDDILDVSKIEAGRITFERAPFDPMALAEQVAQAHAPLADAKGLSLLIDAGPGAMEARIGDRHRIAQILHNLVGNAVKFTERGSVVLSVVGDAEGLRFVVRDEGIGMSPQQAATVFEAFAQGDDSITRRFGGTGLGLTIVKGIVDAMGGEIALETEEGRGTAFTVTLPLPLSPQGAVRPE